MYRGVVTAQRTISREASCRGVGLHGGLPVALTLRPAPANTGPVFRCAMGGELREIPARPASVGDVTNATTLCAGDARVSTVEHLLAAIHSLGVDNVWVDLDGTEIPVMDGSAAPFVDLLAEAGYVDQDADRCILELLEPVEVVEDARRARIEPAAGFGISYTIDFDHPVIGRQEFRAEQLDASQFAAELAPARTFGFLDDVERLRKSGLARGGSLDNTVVLDSDRVLNPGGLRWPDEFVRHKALDLLGDLALLGVAIEGRVVVERGGHALHHALARKLIESPEAWQLCGASEGGGPAWQVERVGVA